MKIEDAIFFIRRQRVMVDRDLADLYQVATKVLNQAVKRNRTRFPDGFMFRLTDEEARELVTNCDRFKNLKHSTATPMAFTDYGVAMLSSVLRSRNAVNVNIRIMKTFVRLRQLALTHKELSQRLYDLERGYLAHDGQIQSIFKALHELLDPPEKSEKSIGFKR